MRRLTTLFVVVTLAVAADQSAAQEVSARASTIRLGGRLHAQYDASSVSDAENDFFFRRARLIADISITDFFGARLQTDFAGGKAQIQDGYVTLDFSPGFELSMGQFKRAFDVFELSSSTDLSLIERDGRVEGASSCAGVGGACSYSRLTEKLDYAGRDAGLRITGSSGRVSWAGTVTNGTGINTSDENDAKSFSGRLTLAATDELRISGQLGLHDYERPSDEEDVYGTAWGADLEYGGWRSGLHLQAAMVGGDNWKELDTSDEAATFLAGQAVVSWYAPLSSERLAGIEPLARVSYADPNTSADDDGGLVFTPGLMLYVSGKNKIGFNLDVYSPQTGDTEYSLKVQSFLYF